MYVRLNRSIIVKTTTDKIYNVLRNMEKYPSFVKNVKKVKILRNSKNGYISRWIVDIDGAKIMWREEDKYSNGNTVKFKMLKGDYKSYMGIWRIIKHGHKSILQLRASINWGAPRFLRFKSINQVLIQKTELAMRGLMIAIKKEAERV